ncbi:MAG: hypothetical protein WAV90_12615, partial [Gordonia amarae]
PVAPDPAPHITANRADTGVRLSVAEVEVEPWTGPAVSGPTVLTLTRDEATALRDQLDAALSTP